MSFMQFYNDGNFVTDWNSSELARSYDLAATAERLTNFQVDPDSSVPASEPSGNTDPVADEPAPAASGSANSFIERTI